MMSACPSNPATIPAIIRLSLFIRLACFLWRRGSSSGRGRVRRLVKLLRHWQLTTLATLVNLAKLVYLVNLSRLCGGVLAILLGLLLPVAPAAAALTAVEELQQFYNSSQTLRAQFTQQTITKTTQLTSSGLVIIARPDRFIWQIDKPYVQRIIGDGKRVWLYDPELKQATSRTQKNMLEQTPAQLLSGKKSLQDGFSLKLAPTQDELNWVIATPRQESQFIRIELGLKNGVLHKMVLVDGLQQKTTVTFANVERNPHLDAGQFKFTPPPNTDVISD